MNDRRLRITYRHVPPADRATHTRLWEPLARSAAGEGAHAWRFVSEADPALIVEFIESGEDSGVAEDPAVIQALEALARRFPDRPENVPSAGIWRPVGE